MSIMLQPLTHTTSVRRSRPLEHPRGQPMTRRRRRSTQEFRDRLLAMVLTTLVTSLVGCSLSLPSPKPKTRLVVGIFKDASSSVSVEESCAQIGARVRQVLRQAKRRPIELIVLASGGPATSNEPIALVPWTSWHPSHRLFGQRGARQAAEHSWLKTVITACAERITAQPSSPLFHGIRRAVADLNARCAALAIPAAQCKRSLYIHSDLRSSEPAFRAGAKAHLLPEPLPTTGIRIQVCGVAETRAVNRRYTFVEATWRRVLGDGAPTFFSSTCPMPLSNGDRQ